MPADAISDIIANLEVIASTDDALVTAMATIAVSAVKASASRALIEKARLGAMARLTVAVSAVSPLNAYLASASRNDTLDESFRDIIRTALAVAPDTVVRHDPTDDGVDIEAWETTEKGYIRRHFKGVGEITVSYNPHMPGGDWTLGLSGIPLLYGTNPSELVEKTADLVEFISPTSVAELPSRNVFKRMR